MDSEKPLIIGSESLSSRMIRLDISYNGAPFSGWQIQPAQQVRTIQGEIQYAIEQVTSEHVELIGSGRTDAGVHALCQTAAFRTYSKLAPERFQPALNSFLPPEIRVLRSCQVRDDFHPIRDVVRKRYRYLLSDSRPVSPFLRNNVWFVLRRIDFDRMVFASRFIPGRRDFASFQTTGSPRSTTVRTVFDLSVQKISFPNLYQFPLMVQGAVPPIEIYSIEIEADGFLYNMVRSIAGTLVAFGQKRPGFDPPEQMEAILRAADRTLAGPTAPAHGLYLLSAVYPDDFMAEGENES